MTRKMLIYSQIDLNGENPLSATASESEEENIIVTREEEEVDPEDEADFEREYAKMMAESLESRKHERKATFDVPLPMLKKNPTTMGSSWTEENTNGATATPPGTVAFSLLTKRGNRQQVRSTEHNLLKLCSHLLRPELSHCPQIPHLLLP